MAPKFGSICVLWGQTPSLGLVGRLWDGGLTPETDFPTVMRAAESTDCVTGAEPAEVSDLDLVRRAQAGDADAFGELVERNRRAVFRAALAALGSAAEADDVAQDAFVMAYRKDHEFSWRRRVPDLVAGDRLAQGARSPQEPDALAAAHGPPRRTPMPRRRTGSSTCPLTHEPRKRTSPPRSCSRRSSS